MSHHSISPFCVALTKQREVMEQSNKEIKLIKESKIYPKEIGVIIYGYVIDLTEHWLQQIEDADQRWRVVRGDIYFTGLSYHYDVETGEHVYGCRFLTPSRFHQLREENGVIGLAYY